MKKIVVYNGSPRMDGNTVTFLNMVARGAREHNAEVKFHTLFKMKFMACQGCFGCRLNDSCVISDELTDSVNKDLKDADAIIIGSPVYFMQVTGPVKNLYDRLFPLVGENGQPRFGDKKIVTVYSQEFDDIHMFDGYFDYLAATFSGYGFVDEERIVLTNTNNPEAVEKNEALLKHAYDIGRMLATM